MSRRREVQSQKKDLGYMDEKGNWAISRGSRTPSLSVAVWPLAAVNCAEHGARCQACIDRTGSVRSP